MRGASPAPSWARLMRRLTISKNWNARMVDDGLAASLGNWQNTMPDSIKPLLAGFPVVVQLPVVWGEMDSYRHVNNVVYFRYFESARLEYFRRLDWFEYEKETGIGPILASTQARFRRPLTYPDTVLIMARVGDLGEDRFTLGHRVISR